MYNNSASVSVTHSTDLPYFHGTVFFYYLSCYMTFRPVCLHGTQLIFPFAHDAVNTRRKEKKCFVSDTLLLSVLLCLLRYDLNVDRDEYPYATHIHSTDYLLLLLQFHCKYSTLLH